MNEGSHMNTTIRDESGSARNQASPHLEGEDVDDDHDADLEAIPPIKSLFLSRLREKTTAEKVNKIFDNSKILIKMK